MKELSIEEKAKAYDEAIKRGLDYIKHTPATEMVTRQDIFEAIFPELKESEDEKIKNKLINLIKMSSEVGGLALHKWEADEMLAWVEKQGEHNNFIDKIQVGDKVTRNEDGMLVNLSQLDRVAKKDEKQGEQKPYGQRKYCSDCQFNYAGECKGSCQMKRDEQKPADKVEPKFKEGDWIIYRDEGCTEILRISDVTKTHYICIDISDDYCRNLNINFIDSHNYHLWTIQDAKDGDVLTCESGWTCIFKTLVNDETFSSYCFMDKTKWFCATGNACHTLKEEFIKAYNGKIHPSTKEQRDLLFQKMKEAGYEWDAEKKELKKIEQMPWSEEDNIIAHEIDYALRCQITYPKSILDSMSSWIYNLKDRVQPKQEWSEEDEKKRNLLISILKVNHPNDYFKVNPANTLNMEAMHTEKLVDWLKSLRPKNTWKPDFSMLICLEYAIKHINKDGDKRILSKLLEQLKKLREGKLS